MSTTYRNVIPGSTAMSNMDEDEYEYDEGDIPDEVLIEAFSQASQTLPSLLLSPRPPKRRRIGDASDNDSDATRRRTSRDCTESCVSGDEEDDNGKPKKKKYRIHVGEKEVPAAQILGATQAEALPDSSPYRIRGPIYRKPRPEPPKAAVPKHPLFSNTPHHPAPQPNPFQRTAGGLTKDKRAAQELEDLPSDAFSSPPESNLASRRPIILGLPLSPETQQLSQASQRLVAPQQGLRQTTLFGGRTPDELPVSQVKKTYNFIKDKPPELPTHHLLDREALKTWIYPTNLGAIRDYQFSIVKNGLFNNLLVALPTGLGKTFIAATIMFNFFRWTKDAQIVFVAPTKPLVAQQVEACFNIVGIPRSATTMLTGEQIPALRAEEWEDKRVFFMTPQTLANDLATGIADPKKIVLLVVDEAHRATGNYAYVTVVQFIRRFNQSFRVLALTATPGASVEAVQEVVDGLEISKVEIRTEESIDIQPFVHRRNIDTILLDPSDEMIMVKELFAKALQPLVNQLCAQNAYYNKDPMSLTPYGLLTAQKRWFVSDAGRRASQGLKGMMIGLFAILASVAHGIKLLNFHGIGPFFSNVKDLRSGVEEGNKGGKYRKQIVDSPDFRKMMDRIQLWLSKDDFVGHPKLTYLCDTILNHFLDAGEGRLGEDAPPSSTRVIVFAEFRDSAEDITRVLNRHGPMIRASVFVGQADSKRSEGMNQAKQLEAISNFKAGLVNVIVATSIGEEGLDIGQVDLIVCYDASASPIRMLQRMGRTGRKRAGNIVLLLMRGKEEESFTKAKDNYEQMQKMITDGVRFNFRHDLSTRIIPRDITPVVDKRIIDIPIENSQNTSLPEPKRRPTRGKKKPPKKFHMPDGVEMGFRKASKLSGDEVVSRDVKVTVERSTEVAKIQITPIPPLDSVLLSPTDMHELERRYQNVTGNDLQEVSMPDMTSQTTTQRVLGRSSKVSHGLYTKRCVRLFKILANSQRVEDRYERPYGDEAPTQVSWDAPPLIEDQSDISKTPARPQKGAPVKRKPPRKAPLVISDVESDPDEQSNEGLANRSVTRKRAVSHSEPEGEGNGEDIMNSEGSSEEDESDDWGSLEDFVVRDDEQASRRKVSAMRSSTTPPATKPDPKPKSSYKLAQFTATQDTNDDDDMPDIGDIVDLKTQATSRSPLDVLDADENVRPVHVSDNRTKKRRVVEENDSDE
jgi:ATP-dependent DNA helicase MPH1